MEERSVGRKPNKPLERTCRVLLLRFGVACRRTTSPLGVEDDFNHDRPTEKSAIASRCQLHEVTASSD
ncbi:MAG: hypothetical protein KME42_08825 [Tildeniella nuda ZEHNDER 1965/U140]|jgi:hypothetical protein|nr:hypothetical protein [Tildeniella nuda ZEHNDER 1965/U140]